MFNAVVFFALSAIQLMAANTGLPWETPIKKVGDSITGPVAFIVGTSALGISAVSMAMHHGDTSDFARYAARGGLCVGAGVLAVPTLRSLTGMTGALI